MRIKEIHAKKIRDSRREDTISVFVKTERGTFSTSSPSGESTGKHEIPSFPSSVEASIKLLEKNADRIKEMKMEQFSDLARVEALLDRNILGANALFALEASLLKAIAAEQEKELWEYLGGRKMPYPIGNIIGGGMHNKMQIKPDFQEFLIIPRVKKIFDSHQIMRKAHQLAGERLKLRGSKGKLDHENAWITELGNEECLEILNETRNEIVSEIDEKIEIGVDMASSTFFSGLYQYKNPERFIGEAEQINYVSELVKKFNLFYVEDPLNEEDFKGFKMVREKVEGRALIVADDLVVSQMDRFIAALKNKSISGVILKPNQTGSLIEIKKISDLAKKYNVATIVSHRAGETEDCTISDLAVGWRTDFIKSGVIGSEREAKFKRLIQIEKRL